MWRVITTTLAALMFCSTVAAAQQPCTTDANRVVAEVYRQMLERRADLGAQTWVRQVANGQLNVKELVRRVAKSQEYTQRFGRTNPAEAEPFEGAVAQLYRHVLGRQPDARGLRSWIRIAQQRGLTAVVDGMIDSAEYNSNFGEVGVPGSAGLRYCGDDDAEPPTLARRFPDRDDTGQDVRSEGRRGVRRASDYDFEALDVNNNNRIERREWQARLEEFNRLNTNGDNFLTRDELDGSPAAAPVATSGRARLGDRVLARPISVGGDRQWVDTGIDVQPGELVSINANGQIRIAPGGGLTTAAGVASGRTDGATMPTANVGGLVARFGNSAPLFIGQNRSFRPATGGRLYLGVNDSFFDDNTGQFSVTVDVD